MIIYFRGTKNLFRFSPCVLQYCSSLKYTLAMVYSALLPILFRLKHKSSKKMLKTSALFHEFLGAVNHGALYSCQRTGIGANQIHSPMNFKPEWNHSGRKKSMWLSRWDMLPSMSPEFKPLHPVRSTQQNQALCRVREGCISCWITTVHSGRTVISKCNTVHSAGCKFIQHQEMFTIITRVRYLAITSGNSHKMKGSIKLK